MAESNRKTNPFSCPSANYIHLKNRRRRKKKADVKLLGRRFAGSSSHLLYANWYSFFRGHCRPYTETGGKRTYKTVDSSVPGKNKDNIAICRQTSSNVRTIQFLLYFDVNKTITNSVHYYSQQCLLTFDKVRCARKV